MKRALGFMNKSQAIAYNTYIGGVSATISTPALLATKLGISVGNITNFEVVGSDIKCFITGSYAMPYSCWINDANITYYIDNDNLVTSIGDYCFAQCVKLTYVKLEGATSENFGSFDNTAKLTSVSFPLFNNSSNTYHFITNFSKHSNKRFHLPNWSTIGTTSGNNNVLINILAGSTLYVPTSLSTNNGGSPDGDIAAAIARGVTVRYISSTVSPNAITDLAVSVMYDTAATFTFTAPTGSTNTIEYYEVWSDGILLGEISQSGGTIRQLKSGSYNFTLKAVDIYFNHSASSNPISASTTTTSYISTRVIAAYNLENGNDSSPNTLNGTVGSAVTFSAFKNNNGAVFTNVANSYISVPDNNLLSFTDGTNDLPFTIKFNVRFTSLSTGTFITLLAKSNFGFNSSEEYIVYMYSNQITLLLHDKTTGSYIYSRPVISFAINTDYTVVLTYNGNKTAPIFEHLINGVAYVDYGQISGTYTGMKNGTLPMVMGCASNLSSYRLEGKMDAVYIFNQALLLEERTDLLTKYYPF